MRTRSVFFWAVSILIILGSIESYAQVNPAGSPDAGTSDSGVKIPTAEAPFPCKDLKYTYNKDGKPTGFIGGYTCMTSQKKCYQVIPDADFGMGLQELGDCEHQKPGLIWAIQLKAEHKNFKDAQKENICPTGTHPPTQKEFTTLRDSVDTEDYKSNNGWDDKYNKKQLSDLGRSELYALLPDMKGHRFWSSSPVDNIGAVAFNALNGHVDINEYLNTSYLSVRCVH